LKKLAGTSAMRRLTPGNWVTFWLKAAGLVLMSLIGAAFVTRLIVSLLWSGLRPLLGQGDTPPAQLVVPAGAVLWLLLALGGVRASIQQIREDYAFFRQDRKPRLVLEDL
jgi:hypothetical protein